MTGPEKTALGRQADILDEIVSRMDRLELRLFGQDGTGGALGELRQEVRPALTFYQRWTGVGIAIGFVFGAIAACAGVIAIVKQIGLI